MKKGLVILSGGQDSTTVLYLALEVFGSVHAVTFDYGQTHALEIQAARKVVSMAQDLYGTRRNITHEVISVPGILHSTSPLTDKDAKLEKYENAAQMEKVIGDRREKTFVPMRNALFLTIAANRAEVLGIKDIVLGICQEDNANYDDCRETFREAAEDYINKALGHDHRNQPKIQTLGEIFAGIELGILVGESPRIRVHAPLMFMSKRETVELAYRTPGAWAALAYSHTSYDGCYPPTDMNHANVLRAKGFEDADLPDPLVVRAYNEGRMQLPNTKNYDTVARKPRPWRTTP